MHGQSRTDVSAPAGREAFKRDVVVVGGRETDGHGARGDRDDTVRLQQGDVVVPQSLHADVVVVDDQPKHCERHLV